MIPPKLPDWEIQWVDSGRHPKHPSDPRYPHGIDIDVSLAANPACKASLPYPTPRCGHYIIECRACGQVVMLSTAGRRDDPRTLKMACRQKQEQPTTH